MSESFFEDAELGTAPGDPVLLQVNTRFQGMNYMTYPEANEEGNSAAVFTDDSHSGSLAIQGEDDTMQHPYSEDAEVVVTDQPASGEFWTKNTGASDGQVIFAINFATPGEQILNGQEWLQVYSQVDPVPADPGPDYDVIENCEGTDGASAADAEYGTGNTTNLNVYSNDHAHAGTTAISCPFSSNVVIRAVGESHGFDGITEASWWTYTTGDTLGWFFVPIVGYYNGEGSVGLFLDDRDSTGTLKIWDYVDFTPVNTGITYPKDTWVEWRFDGLNLSIHPGGGAAIWTSDIAGEIYNTRAISISMPVGDRVWVDDISATFHPADWNMMLLNVLTEETQVIDVPVDAWVKIEWSVDGVGGYTLKVSNGE